jgi:hypothetical protein
MRKFQLPHLLLCNWNKTKRRRLWFKKKWLVCPDNSTIKTALKAKVDNAKKVSKDVASIKAVGKYIPVYYN